MKQTYILNQRRTRKGEEKSYKEDEWNKRNSREKYGFMFTVNPCDVSTWASNSGG